MLDAGLTYKKIRRFNWIQRSYIIFIQKLKNYKQNIWVTYGTKDDAIGYNVAKISYEKYNSYDISLLL